MDAERAELHLRRLAEDQLRQQAEGYGRPPYSLHQLTAAARGPAGAQRSRVAQALMAVGAIEASTAERIQDEAELALAVRQPHPGPGTHPLRPPGVHRRLARFVKAGGPSRPVAWAGPAAAWLGTARPAAGSPAPGSPAPGSPAPGSGAPEPGPAPHRVAPVGMMIPVADEELRGELYLLSYAHTAIGAWFTVVAWLRGRSTSVSFSDLFRVCGLADAQGKQYTIGFLGSGGIAEWSGVMYLHPEPPANAAWLDFVVGETTRRIPLDQPDRPVTVTPVSRTAGEQYLYGIAAHILAGLPVFAADQRLHRFGPHVVLPNSLADHLGDIVAALRAADVLPAASPLPGQLVTLCESVGITQHGLTAPASRDLPEPWVSLLSHFLRRKPDAPWSGEGCAAMAVTLPELDGITLDILGLANGEDGTILNVHVTGMPTADTDNLSDDPTLELPVLWLRDDTGRWHTTRRSVSMTRYPGEVSGRLEIVPPLGRSSRIEILAAGRTTEARVTLPLHWR